MINSKDSASVLVVIFLVIMVVSISAYYIMKKIKDKREDEKTYIKPAAVENKTVKVERVVLQKNEPKEEEITDELMAVLTAAITAIRASEDKAFIVKRVVRRKNRPAWNVAGIKDQVKSLR